MSRYQCVDEFGDMVEFTFGLDGSCYVSTVMGPQWFDGKYDAVILNGQAPLDLHRIIGEHLGLTDA